MIGGAPTQLASVVSLRLGRRLGKTELVAGELARRAHVLSQVAGEDPARRLEAFDAMETALRHFLLAGRMPPQILPYVRGWLAQADYLKPLQTLTRRLLPDEEFREIPPEMEMVEHRFAPIWPGDGSEWVEGVIPIMVWASVLEDRRMALRAAAAPRIQVSSTALTVEHCALQAAAPLGEAILRHPDVDNLLLDLAHEVTHVYSLLGTLGMALWGMRWVILEWETGHLARQFMNRKGEIKDAATETESHYATHRFLRERQPVRLLEPDAGEFIFPDDVLPTELIRAEQQLEGIRKLQLLERVWSPWLEGLALLAESAADPRDDADSFTPVMGVVVNLRDAFDLAQGQPEEIEERVRGFWDEAEKRFADAIKAQSGFRLGGYLTAYPQKYFAGYLVVRSIVSEWRARFDRKLSGAEAFSVLLHVTRFSGMSCLPDPGLSAPAFAAEALARHLEWLRSLTRMPREDLQAIHDCFERGEATPGGHVAWRDGRLEREDGRPRDREQLFQPWLEFLGRFLRTMGSPNAPLDRAAGADAVCQEIMKGAADALAEARDHSSFVNANTVNTLLAGRMVVPLASCEASFWLLTQDRRLACLVRTQEAGGPSAPRPSGPEGGYTPIILPLEAGEYAALEEAVRSGGPSRMRITRAAYVDRLPSGFGPGANFWVFQYEGWLKIKAAGLLAAAGDHGLEQVKSYFQDRFVPPEPVRAQEALTGPEHPCARRTLDWLQKQEWSFPAAGGEFNLKPWAGHVEGLARIILERHENDDVAPVNEALLRFVFGREFPSGVVAREGLQALPPHGAGLAGKVLQAQEANGRAPASGEAADFTNLNTSLNEIGAPWFAQGEQGWDFRRPAKEDQKQTPP